MKTIFLILLIGAIALPGFGQDHQKLQRLTVFFTNDIHGGIVPQKAEFLNPEFPPVLGGGASVAAIISGVRRQGAQEGFETLLIDAGDIFQGTLVGTLSKGMAVVEYMNMMKYDAVTPGNHDFDLGKDNLIELIKASEFSWVAANIYDESTGQPWEWVKPYVIVEKNGIKIGFTGTTTPGTERMSFPENIRGLDFRNEITSLQKAVDEMRSQGVELIVALVHTGLPYDPREGYAQLRKDTYEGVMAKSALNAMEIAHYVKGIDLLLGGHLHKGYREPWEDPVNHTICVQNYGNGGNLGWINLFLDPVDHTLADFSYPADRNTLLLLQQDEFWPDDQVLKFIKKQQAVYEKGFKDIIGETRTSLTRSSLGESPMNNLITDVLRERAGADFSFMNYGGIRADLKVGPLTREDIFRVLPFGNEIVSFEAPGRLIKEILERKVAGGRRGLAISGAKVVINKSLPDGQRVVSVEINGALLDPQRIYRLATSDYLMEGNSGLSMLREIPREEVAFHGLLLREAVIEYIREHSPLKIKLDGRWKLDDSARPSAEWLEKFPPPRAAR